MQHLQWDSSASFATMISFSTCSKLLRKRQFSVGVDVLLSLLLNFKPIEIAFYEGSNNNPASRAIHEKTNRIIEKLSETIHFATIKLGVLGLILPKAVTSYFIYFTTNAGSAAFDLPFSTWSVIFNSFNAINIFNFSFILRHNFISFPFNWRNPVGYVIAVAWECVSVFIFLRFLACMLPMMLACFLLAFSMTKDWKGDLRALNKTANTKHFKQLIEFVRSHSNAKELSKLYTSKWASIWLFPVNFWLFFRLINDFLDIFEICVFVNVMCCTVMLCVVLMMIKIEFLVE